jgi:hypothetical protein
MGREIDCRMRHGKRLLTGRAYLETDHLLFRGQERLKVPLKDLTRVAARGGILRLEFTGGPAELELGPAAEKWAEKILHPASRADRLGVKSGAVVRLGGSFEAEFIEELRARGVVVSQKRQTADWVFFAAEKAGDLAKVSKLAEGMNPDGAMWVVYPKGAAAIREIDVIQAGRAAGLKDVKVVRFSETHTGLKFVVPIASRQSRQGQ